MVMRSERVERVTASVAPPLSVVSVLEDEAADAAGTWCTVVHDDPVNTMTYVVWVLMRHFGLPRALARSRMLQVHHQGRAVVSQGVRRRMEADVAAMHGYGLRATLEPVGAGSQPAHGAGEG